MWVRQTKFWIVTHGTGKPWNGIKIYVLFAIHYHPKHFHIQKYVTNQNQKGICYILDSVQKMTEAEEREDEKNGTDKSLGLMWTAPTPLAHK